MSVRVGQLQLELELGLVDIQWAVGGYDMLLLLIYYYYYYYYFLSGGSWSSFGVWSRFLRIVLVE